MLLFKAREVLALALPVGKKYIRGVSVAFLEK